MLVSSAKQIWENKVQKFWRERKKENRSVPSCTSLNHSGHVLFAVDILLVISSESNNNTRVCGTILLLLFLEEISLYECISHLSKAVYPQVTLLPGHPEIPSCLLPPSLENCQFNTQVFNSRLLSDLNCQHHFPSVYIMCF